MRQYAGVSLVELLVAMLLGLFLIAGIGHLFLSASRTYMLQDELSRIQENARFAMDLLARDIRMAGYTGCPGETPLANVVYTTTDNREWMTHFDKGILGLSTANKSRIDSSAISEAIVIHKIDAEQGQPVNSHTSSSALLNVTSHGFDQGDILALVSPGCDQVSVFKAADGTTGSSVSHAAGLSGTLYNCTSQLKGHFNCMDSAASAEPYSHNQSILFPVTSVAYYLRTNNGQPNLYRKMAGEYTSGNARNAEPLLEGIEGLSFLYGYDSDGNRTPDQYRTADSIGLFSNDWTNVVSVRVELLVRSLTEVAENPQPYFFAGARITPTDHYIRRNFVMTVELRNRVQP
ncbi:PilW family protein [Endozoicomonas euniceicola]|uniref:PilW family protein n=1 Tax=Endozoicomonas euniceicola TaxID=1234143 RepID=A0ABY6GRD1_9GAMM|nr:PilW family protein [Endozoicomonas euniceicola]UYM15312.1 PilW family protein [Endozoicomonas euniceicola]